MTQSIRILSGILSIFIISVPSPLFLLNSIQYITFVLILLQIHNIENRVIHITHIVYVDNYRVKTLCNRTPADGLFSGVPAMGAAGKPGIFLIAVWDAEGVADRISTLYPHFLWILYHEIALSIKTSGSLRAFLK